MTTPESFGKVKNACSGIDIYNHFFLLMDECHQLIKDVDYRTDIVLPMNDFFVSKARLLFPPLLSDSVTQDLKSLKQWK